MDEISIPVSGENLSGENLSGGNSGGSMRAALYRPEKTPAPGVVILQEIFGVNEFVKWIAARLAGDGFTVIAPDLYHRIEPGISLGYGEADLKKALEHYRSLDQNAAQADAEAAVAALRSHDLCTGKVASVGFCLGGKIVLKAAAKGLLDAGGAFYPVEVPSYKEKLGAIACPVQVHLGGKDPHSPEETRNILKAAMDALDGGEYYLHAGGRHGFFNPIRQSAYHPEATEQAYLDLLRFLRENL